MSCVSYLELFVADNHNFLLTIVASVNKKSSTFVGIFILAEKDN